MVGPNAAMLPQERWNMTLTQVMSKNYMLHRLVEHLWRRPVSVQSNIPRLKDHLRLWDLGRAGDLQGTTTAAKQNPFAKWVKHSFKLYYLFCFTQIFTHNECYAMCTAQCVLHVFQNLPTLAMSKPKRRKHYHWLQKVNCYIITTFWASRRTLSVRVIPCAFPGICCSKPGWCHVVRRSNLFYGRYALNKNIFHGSGLGDMGGRYNMPVT